ncbi:MAG: nucleoside/nucleotide kinase family protein [Rhodobacterales bacterium]|nr:nucleoside/nucleotide kinase family protein [Rhodobacterales bacterium]
MPTKTDLETLANHMVAQQGTTRHIIAIAGPPGAGKSTLSDALRDRINLAKPQSCEVLPMDGYHFDDIYLEQKGWRARKGAPHTFDVAGFGAILGRLRTNTDPEIVVPVFDRTLEIARAGARAIHRDVRTVIIEGNYLLLTSPPWAELRACFDTTVMLTVPVQILEMRLIERWAGFGFSKTDAAAKIAQNDMLNIKEVMENSNAADFSISCAG